MTFKRSREYPKSQEVKIDKIKIYFSVSRQSKYSEKENRRSPRVTSSKSIVLSVSQKVVAILSVKSSFIRKSVS